jgi:DnaK suppressor protein
MAAKKPAKATKAKKTIAKKADSAKKAAPAKKPPVAVAKPKPAPSPKAVAKPAAKPTAAPVPKPAVKAQPAPASVPAKPVRATATIPAKPTIPARSVTPLNINDLDAAASGEADEGESPEVSSTNLLAGPRNVKPYIPRRGEQYMNKEQTEHFRLILNTWKRDLMNEVDRTVLHMKDEAANFPDPNDRATQESEFSLELRTRDRVRKLIRKIDEAI